MKVLVVGATGGSGRAAVGELLAAGHEVTAFARSAESLRSVSESLRSNSARLEIFPGDATVPGDIDRAVQDQEAVLVTLGISENPVRVRLRGTARTPIDVRSHGTRNVIEAMKSHGVRRLVVQTSYGVGATSGKLPLRYRLMFRVLLGPQIDDTEVQDRQVRESGLDWVIAQPVNLTDADEQGAPFTSPRGEVNGWHISRAKVGRFLVDALTGSTHAGSTVALS